MVTTEEVGRLLDNLHEQLALAEVRLAELVGRAMIAPERAKQFQARLAELRGELSLGSIDDVRLGHTSQQFLNLACEIWLEPAPVDPDRDKIDDFLRLEVIRLAGEQSAIGAEMGRIRSMTEREYRDQDLDDIRLLEARHLEVTKGLEMIHEIRVRLGLVG